MGGDKILKISTGMLNDFNPHLRMGGDSSISSSISNDNWYFNPHLRMGGDLINHISVNPVNNFNPHLRMGGDIKLDTG